MISDLMDDGPKTDILKKLHEIFRKVESLPKDGRNDFHGYNFASESSAKRALHPLFAEYGVILKTDIINVEQVTRVITDKNHEPKELTKVTLAYRFIDCETGSNISGTFVGYGEDTNDKGIWKAVTGCVKYILFNTFLIPTGDDPDNDPRPAKPAKAPATPAGGPSGKPYYPPKKEVTAPVKPDAATTSTGHVRGTMTAAQNAKIYAMLGELKVEKEKADAWVGKVIPGKERISALSIDEAATVIEHLEVKLAKATPAKADEPFPGTPEYEHKAAAEAIVPGINDINYLEWARNCASQKEAEDIIANMRNAKASGPKIAGVLGLLKGKGYNVA